MKLNFSLNLSNLLLTLKLLGNMKDIPLKLRLNQDKLKSMEKLLIKVIQSTSILILMKMSVFIFLKLVVGSLSVLQITQIWSQIGT